MTTLAATLPLLPALSDAELAQRKKEFDALIEDTRDLIEDPRVKTEARRVYIHLIDVYKTLSNNCRVLIQERKQTTV